VSRTLLSLLKKRKKKQIIFGFKLVVQPSIFFFSPLHRALCENVWRVILLFGRGDSGLTSAHANGQTLIGELSLISPKAAAARKHLNIHNIFVLINKIPAIGDLCNLCAGAEKQKKKRATSAILLLLLLYYIFVIGERW